MWHLVTKCCKNDQKAGGRSSYITTVLKGQMWDFGSKCWTPYANFIAHSSWVRNPEHDLNVINILQVFPTAEFLYWELKGKCKPENMVYICMTDIKTHRMTFTDISGWATFILKRNCQTESTFWQSHWYLKFIALKIYLSPLSGYRKSFYSELCQLSIIQNFFFFLYF